MRLAPELLLFIGMAVGLDWLTRDQDDPRLIPGWNRGLGPLLCSLLVLCVIVLTPLSQQSFVYFQF